MNMRYLFGTDYKRQLQEEVRRTPLSPTSKVLNIACEYDLVPDFLKTDISESQVFGIEIDKRIVERNTQIKYCDVDHDAFPFPSDDFDLVLSIFGIEHFKTDSVFKEAYRVLKPGGRFIFIVPNLLYPMFLMNRLLGERFARFYYRTIVQSTYLPHRAYYRFNTSSKIEKTCRRIGFAKIDILMFGPSNVLGYVRKFAWAKKMVMNIEHFLTNEKRCRFKPYMIVVLEK